MILKQIFLVGLGGFAGAVFRFVAALVFAGYGGRFPVGTMVVNLVGCFLIGLLIGVFERYQISAPQVRLFLATGFLGGFTTFSAFGLESFELFRRGELFFCVSECFDQSGRRAFSCLVRIPGGGADSGLRAGFGLIFWRKFPVLEATVSVVYSA